eukprot:jgi/Galph1/2608/GphlegSOOS_G1240.1
MKSIYHVETLSLSKRSHIAFENNEWKKIIFKSLEYEKIFITTDAGVSDISFKLHSVYLAPSLVVDIVCKRCWKSEGLNWSDITDEDEKFLLLFMIKYSVTTELNDESRCYSSGSLIDDTFKIPPNCEFVILSENGLEMFIEKEILTGLGRAFARTDKPTLDLIGTDFMQQICSWLML